MFLIHMHHLYQQIEKKSFLILCALIGISALLSVLALMPGHIWGGDFSMYITQAGAIVTGDLQGLLEKGEFVTAYSEIVLGPVVYPWGFPVLLSLVYLIFGLNIYVMKLYMVGFFLLSIPVIYFLFKDKTDKLTALLIAAIFAFNPTIIKFNNNGSSPNRVGEFHPF